jgi:hypothetical protein
MRPTQLSRLLSLAVLLAACDGAGYVSGGELQLLGSDDNDRSPYT